MFKSRSKNDVRKPAEDGKVRASDLKKAESKPRPLDVAELAKVAGGTQAPKGGWSSR